MHAIDAMAQDGHVLGRRAFCQYGYSTIIPEVPSAHMLESAAFLEHLRSAEVVVSHGGPGSIIPVLRAGRQLVLVPRRKEFGEHVDNHQVAFCRRIAASHGISTVEDIGELESAIQKAFDAGPRGANDLRRSNESLVQLSRLIASTLNATESQSWRK